jgi:phage-related protein
MTWKIALFESSRGEKPVEEFINSCNSSTKGKIISKLNLLKEFGFQLGMPHSKKLTRDLYELRIRGKEEVRIIYVFKNAQIIFLHAFKKKTRKTPQREIEIAQKRLDKI